MAYTKKFTRYYEKLGWGNFSLDFYNTLKNYFPKGKFRYLDIACGTGILADKVARLKRVQVDAFDSSPAMISLAKRKSKRVHFFIADMKSFKIFNRYDLITCLYDSINCLEGLDKWAKFFKNVRYALKKDGVFIFDYNNLKAKKNWQKKHIRNFGKFQIIQKGIKIQNGVALNLQVFYENRKIIEENFVNYMYPSYKIMKILKKLRFVIIEKWQNKLKSRNFIICKKI